MFLESFRHLIEIVALKKQNELNRQSIMSESKRISDLVERRKKTESRISTIDEEVKNLKLPTLLGEVERAQQRLSKLQSQLSMSTTGKEESAFLTQIEALKKEISISEDEYFKSLEKSENLQDEKNESIEFLNGSLKTLEEIEVDVRSKIDKNETEISNRQKRISSLLEQCQPSVRNMYGEVESRFKNKASVSFLIDKKCSECHMLADSMLKTSLEEGRSLEFCPSCGRMLIPETAKIY